MIHHVPRYIDFVFTGKCRKHKCYRKVFLKYTTNNKCSVIIIAVGANIHWRSKETASDEASSLLAVQEFLKHHPEVDLVTLIQCTSPYIKSVYLKRGLNEIYNGHECVFSVMRFVIIKFDVIYGILFVQK